MIGHFFQSVRDLCWWLRVSVLHWRSKKEFNGAIQLTISTGLNILKMTSSKVICGLYTPCQVTSALCPIEDGARRRSMSNPGQSVQPTQCSNGKYLV